jgi:hypothetical protein
MIAAGKIDEAIHELKNIARINNKKLSDETLKMLEAYKNANDKEIEKVNANNIHVPTYRNNKY